MYKYNKNRFSCANNIILVLFELPWQFGLGSFALYLIGIAQTLADVSFYINRLQTPHILTQS